MIALTHAEVASPALKGLVELLMAQSHLCVQGITPGNHSAARACALLPVVHVVLLKGPCGTEASDTSQSQGFFHLGRGSLIDIDPRPHLDVLRPTWVPDSERS